MTQEQLAELLGVSCDYLLKENVTKKDYDTVGKGKPFMQTRLLNGLVSKKVKINLLDGDIDVNYFDKVCEIIDVDDKWVLVRYINGKKTKEKLINLSVLEGAKYK